MIIEIKIPGAGESVTEAAIGNWLVEDGSFVDKDQEIAEVETDKATLPLIATESGRVKILVKAGNKVQIGEIACTIDTSLTGDKARKASSAKTGKTADVSSVAAATSEEHMQPNPENPTPQITKEPLQDSGKTEKKESNSVKVTPLARTIMDQNDLDVDDIIKGLKKITKHEVEQVINKSADTSTKEQVSGTAFSGANRNEERITLSPLRRKLSKRLVAVRNETAMLTTFNEVDMTRILEIRKKFQAEFQEKYGLKPGMVSFFAMACTKALMQFPRVNSSIDGDEIITPNYVDISIAVQTEKGLMAPVIRNTHKMRFNELESEINKMAQKARATKLSIEEMTGGTFTITNGGIFGSMLSTPILNPPQSAILGMHNIVERPVAIDGKVEIRPIMYVALSYDHRLIDGRESVSFLVRIKELIESPLKMLIDGADPDRQLLGL